MARDIFECFVDIFAIGVAVDQDGIAAAAARQIVKRRVSAFPLYPTRNSTAAMADMVTGPRRRSAPR